MVHPHPERDLSVRPRCRGRTLVPLAEELEALERHRALAEIRYAGDGISQQQ